MFEPQHKTQWSMDEQDIFRLSGMLESMNEASIQLQNGKASAAMPLHSVMYEIYTSILRPIINRNFWKYEETHLTPSATIDKRFTDLRQEIVKWQRSPNFTQGKPIKRDIFLGLMELKIELMDWRYKLGLSVKTSRSMDFAEKGQKMIVGK